MTAYVMLTGLHRLRKESVLSGMLQIQHWLTHISMSGLHHVLRDCRENVKLFRFCTKTLAYSVTGRKCAIRC